MEFLFLHPFNLNQVPFELAIPLLILVAHCTRTRSLSRVWLRGSTDQIGCETFLVVGLVVERALLRRVNHCTKDLHKQLRKVDLLISVCTFLSIILSLFFMTAICIA
jgi:hypothetical protein